MKASSLYSLAPYDFISSSLKQLILVPRYPWPEGWAPDNMADCPDPLFEHGYGIPEQFWNCAEVTIENRSENCNWFICDN